MSEPGAPDLPDSRIDVESRAGVWLLSLHGEHDIATQPSLREQLGHVRAAGGRIVVDLSGAGFVDSAIIGALLEGAEAGSAVRCPWSRRRGRSPGAWPTWCAWPTRSRCTTTSRRVSTPPG